MAKKYTVKKAQVGLYKDIPIPSISDKRIDVRNTGRYDLNSLSLAGSGGIDDIISLANGIGNIGNNNPFNIINPAARIITKTANDIQEIKNRKQEQEQYLKALQSPSYESGQEDGIGDLPMYAKNGGALDKGEASALLNQGTVYGHKITSRQAAFLRLVARGKSPEAARKMIDSKMPKKAEYGLEAVKGVSKDDNPNVEAEKGEVFQEATGQIKKVSDNGNTHEQGGELLQDVSRVLENTSTMRKDTDSQHLKLSPMMAELLTGHNPGKEVSHSKALELALEKNNKHINKLQAKLKSNVKSLTQTPNNKFAQNSMDMNLQHLQTVPTEGELFDKLFDHQEFIKQMAGIEQPKAKCGGKYKVSKAQVGVGHNWRPNRRNPNFNPNDWQYINGKWYHIPAGSDEPTGNLAKSKTLGNVTVYSHGNQGNGLGVGPQLTPDNNPNYNWYMPDSPIPTLPTGNENGVSAANTSGNPDGASGSLGQGTPTAANTANGDGSSDSRFNQPLNWYDVAGPLQGLLDASQRIPVKYNPIEVPQIRLNRQNPTPALQSGQAAFNAALKLLPANGQGYANLANIFTSKYSLDNQILGNDENVNKDIKNKETMYNATARGQQSQADQQARELFERKQLGSLEAQSKQKRTSWDELYQRLAQNAKLNREGNLLMQLFPNFNQQGQFNGRQYIFRRPLGIPTAAASAKPKK